MAQVKTNRTKSSTKRKISKKPSAVLMTSNSRRGCNANTRKTNTRGAKNEVNVRARSCQKCKGGFKPAMQKLRRGETVLIEEFFDRGYFEFLCLIGYERAVPEDLVSSLARTTRAKAEFMVALGISEGLLKKKALLLEEDEVTPEKPWVFLTGRGLRAAGLPRSYYLVPQDGNRRHARGVQKVLRGYLTGKFGNRYKKGHQVSERHFFELCDQKDHIADVGIEVDGEIKVLVELELSRKRLYEVVAVLKKMIKLYPKAKIHYHCAPYARPVVERAIRKLGLKKRVRVFDAPKFAGLA